MGLVRSRADNQLADLDHELEAAISRMRQTPYRDERRELLRTRIDELLDRRLQLQQDDVSGPMKSSSRRPDHGAQ